MLSIKVEVEYCSIGFAAVVAPMQSDGKMTRSNSISSPLRAEGLNTYSPSIRQKSIEDGELYIAGQCLVPVVNNPSSLHRSNSGSYGILSWPASAVDKAWADAVPPPPSGLHREVCFSDFDDYRVRVGTLMHRYLHRRMSVQQDHARRLSVADPEGVMHGEMPKVYVCAGCGYLRGEGLVQALRRVPSLYFQEDFSLTRPETFSQVVRGETPEERNTTLETLNNALDIVETELLNEIAARSDSFFEAAESLQELRRSMGDTLFQIQRLQIHASDIDSGMCSRAEHIHTLHKKRCHLEATLDVLKMVETVTNAQEAVNLLLLARDYPSALDLIDHLKQQYEDASPSGILAQGAERLKCLRHVPDALDASSVSLRACLIGELLELLDWDEGESVLRTVAAKALGEEGRIGTTMTPTNEQWMTRADKISHILMGLSRSGSLTGTFTEVIPHAVSRLNGCLRNLIEILIPNFVPVDEVDSPCSQTDQVPSIAHDKFLAVLSACHSVATQCIRHYRRLGEVMLEATDEAGIIQHRAAIDRGRTDLCQALMDANQRHWLKLFQSRMDVHRSLSLDQLQQLKELDEEAEALGSTIRTGQKVGTMLQSLCKTAMDTMQRRNVMGLQAALEQESWKLSTVDPFVQQTIFQTFHSDVPLTNNADEKCPTVKLGEREYRVAHAVLVLSLMICEAIGHNRRFPDCVTETGRHLIELITIFNTRSCQLVLGAQAMQVSGLKSITAKHLALCSQSILFLREMHPYICTALLDACPQVKRTILQPELERIKQDLTMHLNGIHSKLVGIMKERLQIGIRQLRDEIHSAEASETVSPSQASQQIAKQLRILTQVLMPILHEHQMTEICTNVAEIFGEELASAFQEIVEDYELLSRMPKEQDGCPDPLEDEEGAIKIQSRTEEEWSRIDIRRSQLLADCRFMTETISRLPVGDRSSSLVSPLTRIDQMLCASE